jgi:hypothetical protein
MTENVIRVRRPELAGAQRRSAPRPIFAGSARSRLRSVARMLTGESVHLGDFGLANSELGDLLAVARSPDARLTYR